MGLLFYGHSAGGIFYDIFLAIVSIVLMFIFTAWYPKMWWPTRVGVGYVTMLFFPNALYLATESRHLLEDRIEVSVMSVVFFGAVSSLGIALAIITNLVALRKIPSFGKLWVTAAFGLSFLAAWGTALGLMRLNSVDGLTFQLAILFASIRIIASWKWLGLITAMATLLFTATLGSKTILQRPSARGN